MRVLTHPSWRSSHCWRCLRSPEPPAPAGCVGTEPVSTPGHAPAHHCLSPAPAPPWQLCEGQEEAPIRTHSSPTTHRTRTRPSRPKSNRDGMKLLLNYLNLLFVRKQFNCMENVTYTVSTVVRGVCLVVKNW